MSHVLHHRSERTRTSLTLQTHDILYKFRCPNLIMALSATGFCATILYREHVDSPQGNRPKDSAPIFNDVGSVESKIEMISAAIEPYTDMKSGFRGRVRSKGLNTRILQLAAILS